MNFDQTVLAQTKIFDTPFLTLENFDVRAVNNGWIVQICGYVFDPENDWDADPKEYQNVTVVVTEEDELGDLLAYLVTVPRHQD